MGVLNAIHLRTLREVARQQSFSRAARTLHLSQPAVSHHVRQLEETVGARLLERVGKRAYPTPLGSRVLEHAERALAELVAAREAATASPVRLTGRVRIGTGATASIHLLPPLLKRLHRRYPGIDLVVVTGNSEEMAVSLMDNALDVGVLTLPVRGRALSVWPFFVDRLVAIAPARTERGPMTPARLARHPLILYERGGTSRTIIDTWFRRADVTPRVAMELGSVETIKRLVEAGLGLSVGSAISVREEVRAGRLRAHPLVPRLDRTLGVVLRRDKPRSPALDVVVEAFRRFGATSPAPAGRGTRSSSPTRPWPGFRGSDRRS